MHKYFRYFSGEIQESSNLDKIKSVGSKTVLSPHKVQQTMCPVRTYPAFLSKKKLLARSNCTRSSSYFANAFLKYICCIYNPLYQHIKWEGDIKSYTAGCRNHLFSIVVVVSFLFV